MRTGHIAEPVHTAFMSHKAMWAVGEKSRKMSTVAVILRLFRQFSYRQNDAVVCICCNGVSSQDDRLLDFGDQARTFLEFIERYSSRMHI